MKKGIALNLGIATACIGLIGAGFIGCNEPEPDSYTGEVLESTLDRESSPEIDDSSRASLVGGNTAFALDMYRNLDESEDGNLFFSPLSMSLALAMVHAGARGETEAEMADVLHFDLTRETLHPAFNWLDLELERRGSDGGFDLSIANSIWGQIEYPFEESYLDVLGVNYGSGLRTVDFANEPERAREAINNWVAEETNDRIEDLMPDGSITPLTRLVLANAIYFHADWLEQFDPDDTHDGTFATHDGGQVTVPLMHQEANFSYTEGDGYQAIELPYEGEQVSMVIMLPTRAGFEDFEASLNPERLTSIVDGLEPTEVLLTLPRFTFDSEFNLTQTLQTMGMTNAFGGGADFTGIEASGELFISTVVHKAFVGVNEEGTEAAAATGIAMSGTSEPMGVQFIADHPFLFLIRDMETGTLLFLGRVLDPS